MGLNNLDDSPEGIARYLQRNPSTCFAAEEEGELVGVILSGHDGRRGFIYHLRWQRPSSGAASAARSSRPPCKPCGRRHPQSGSVGDGAQPERQRVLGKSCFTPARTWSIAIMLDEMIRYDI
jgi:hypothetical protein